jgi:hypothetical protein
MGKEIDSTRIGGERERVRERNRDRETKII